MMLLSSITKEKFLGKYSIVHIQIQLYGSRELQNKLGYRESIIIINSTFKK